MTAGLVSVRQEVVDANVLRTVFVSVEQKVPADFPVNKERSDDSMKQSLSISP